MDFDDLTQVLGEFGKYQQMLYFLACLAAIPAAFNTMGVVFTGAVPEHWCDTPELDHLNLKEDVIRNLTIPFDEGSGTYSSCKRYVSNYSTWTHSDLSSRYGRENLTEYCPQGWKFDDSVYKSTIVTEFGLVCDKIWLQSTATVIYVAGQVISSPIMGSLADIFGRRPALIASMLGTLILQIATGFASNYVAFVIIRFFSGFCSGALYNVGFVIAVELVGPTYRMHCGIAYQYFWSVGYMLFALFAYYLRDWSMLRLVTSCCLIPIGTIIFFIPESPRWLYVHGKDEEANKIIQKAARINNVELPSDVKVTFKTSPTGYFWDLVRTKRMAIRSLIIFLNWFANNVVYFGLSWNTSNLAGNDFANFVMSAAIEVPAYIVTQLALHYIGRRWPMCVAMVIGGVALLCTLAVPEDLGWLVVTLSMLGRFCIVLALGTIYIFTAELYPTAIRSNGVAIASVFGNVGILVAPYLVQLGLGDVTIPMVVFGALVLVSGCASFLLPETKAKHLPETLEDGEKFGMYENRML